MNMKICAVICEFNPFHNGHAYLLSRAKRLSGCDAVVCVMSGSFTQRGEICRTDKYLRARHAILCGADAVIELPTPFAVAPAEIFARGAVKVISRLGADCTLAFGCEGCDPCEGCEPCDGCDPDEGCEPCEGYNEDGVCGTDCEDGGELLTRKLTQAVEILICESARFKAELKRGVDGGESYAKSYANAFTACGGDGQLLSSPNNILGVEYVKAVRELGVDINFIPVKRVGAGYRDERLAGTYSSASAIRANAGDGQIRQAMPECSYGEFIRSTDNRERFERFAVDTLFTCNKRDLARVYGCTEGLENRLKRLAEVNGYSDILTVACNRRYPKARISRIICANLLGLYADQTEKFLLGNLPVKILAVKKSRADELLPVLTVKGEPSAEETACAEITAKSYALWRHLSAPLIYDNPLDKMALVDTDIK